VPIKDVCVSQISTKLNKLRKSPELNPLKVLYFGEHFLTLFGRIAHFLIGIILSVASK